MKITFKKILNSKIKNKFFAFYEKIFGIKEIERSEGLVWVFGATLFSYFITFMSWAVNPTAMTKYGVESGQYTCWQYYQDCGKWHILEGLPDGYSQTILYMFFFGLMILSIIFLKKKKYILAHMMLVPIWFWHFLLLFVLTDSLGGNYEYFLFVFGTILLFIQHKEWFLKVSLALFYFLASTIKIHEGWISGTYFTALKTGAPLIPDWLVPVATNFTILAQMVLVWFIFSKNKVLRNLMILYFLFFHFYSGILVGYKYPSVVIPTFIILYILFYRWQKPPFDKKAIAGWVLLGLMFIIQFFSILIPGDEKLTLEGNKYMLYMFEANHQCISTIKLKDKNNKIHIFRTESNSARNRCDPYKYWFRLKNTYCRTGEKVKWTFDHSINGNPFLRIVDVENACDLEYKAFEHNSWIKTEEDKPKVIGYPVENLYY